MAENSLLLNRADAAVLSHDYALAARLYSTLLRESPDNKEILKRLGNVYIKSGDDNKALDVFKKLDSVDKNNSATLLSLGGIYRRLKKYDESIGVLDKALECGAKEVEVYYNKGFTYKLMEKYAEAIDCFENVIALNANDVLAYNHLGTIHELKKNHEAAIQSYLMGLKVDPNHPILHLNLAKSYDASGNSAAAVREYEAALRYKPGWDEAYLNYIKMLLREGKFSEARNYGEQSIQLNSNNARLQELLGDVYMAESDFSSAEKKYNDSVQLDPNRAKSLRGLALSLEAQGKNTEAVDAISKAKELSPEDDALVKDSASINLSAKKMAEANKDIKQLMKKDSDDIETLDLAGQYFIVADEEAKAEAYFRRIQKTDPSYKKHLSNASKRYSQKGNLQKARDCIRLYLNESPQDVKAYVSLAVLEEKLGNINDALAAYNKALSYDAENLVAKKSSKRLATSIGTENAAVKNAAPTVEEDLNSGFEDSPDLEINMGMEEELPNDFAEDAEEDDISNFDFDAFGKSPLIDDEADSFFSFDEFSDSEGPGVNDIAAEDETPETENEPEQVPEIEQEPESEADIESEPEPESPSAPETESLPEKETESEAETVEEETPETEIPPEVESGPEPLPESTDSADKDKTGAELSDDARQELLDKMAEISENAERALNAADKAWWAAQQAADNLQGAEQAQNEMNRRLEEQQAAFEEQKAALEEAAKKAAEDDAVRTVPPADEEQKIFNAAVQKANNVIPVIENILREDKRGRDFSSEIKLFKTLRALSESLPEEKRHQFMQSRTRLSLDYLISSLEGRVGLLKTSVALRKSGVLEDAIPEEAVNTDYSMDELAKIVITDMKALSGKLEEDDLVVALNSLADSVLSGK